MINILVLNKKTTNQKRKRGFTLIELICVMSIMAIIAVVTVPKISGYIEQAKKTKALAKAREVVMAAETYNFNAAVPIGDDIEYSAFKQNLIDSKYLELDTDAEDKVIDTVSGDIKYSDLKKIVEGKQSFSLNEGKIVLQADNAESNQGNESGDTK